MVVVVDILCRMENEDTVKIIDRKDNLIFYGKVVEACNKQHERFHRFVIDSIKPMDKWLRIKVMN